jgi:hypothetical protein
MEASWGEMVQITMHDYFLQLLASPSSHNQWILFRSEQQFHDISVLLHAHRIDPYNTFCVLVVPAYVLKCFAVDFLTE